MTQINLITKQKQAHRHRKQTYGYQKVGGDKLGVWDSYIHTNIYGVDNQQGPTE